MTTHPRPQLSPNYQTAPPTPSLLRKIPHPPRQHHHQPTAPPSTTSRKATAAVDLFVARVPALLAYRISVVHFMADTHSGEVFVKIRLVPICHGEPAVDVGATAAEGRAQDDCPKSASFAKTLMQADANNGGGFSVPRICTETIFPALDYSSEPPV
ncbi:hypothetical protein ZWY2020_016190 [Hordeum vulgare]|nr:hypothetical protein ZWY2020_016190 [Hordeum vulgare]